MSEENYVGEGTSVHPDGLVPAEVPAELLEEMLQLGFSRNRAIRAIHFSDAAGINQAFDWLTENEEMPDLDDALFVKPRKIMTHEEKRRYTEEIRLRANLKREKEEKEAERLKERERIRAGKEMQAAMEKEKEQELQRSIEQRKRTKKADEVAREKIHQKLEQDKRERRVKRGLPPELSEAEKQKQREKEEAKKKEIEEKSLRHIAFVKPVGQIDKLRRMLVDMKQNSNDAEFKTASGIMMKYIGNVIRSPEEEKYRRIRLLNESFQKKVVVVQGSFEFLLECGFSLDQTGEHLVMKREEILPDRMTAATTVLDNAIHNPFFGEL